MPESHEVETPVPAYRVVLDLLAELITLMPEDIREIVGAQQMSDHVLDMRKCSIRTCLLILLRMNIRPENCREVAELVHNAFQSSTVSSIAAISNSSTAKKLARKLSAGMKEHEG